MPEALSKQETKCAFADAQTTHKRPDHLLRSQAEDEEQKGV
jgi:hypothetical protein